MSICQDSLHEYKLRAEGVSKTFSNALVVNKVTITLKNNEFVSIIGPSGSGKTTIFNIIAGLLTPDEGRIKIDGEDFTGKTGRVSYMYQKDLLLPWMNIVDNAAMPLLIKGINKRAARNEVKQYFEMFGLEGFQLKYPSQLSGGMRQRAALLRTYMFSKDIILLDEPFGGLDAINRSKLQNWLLSVLENLNTSILFITHDIEEAIFLSDRIYVLSERPAEIKDEIIVDLPKPRDKNILTGEGFNRIKRRILEIL